MTSSILPDPEADLTRIINSGVGKTVVKRVETETTDDMGRVTGRSVVNTNIDAIILPIRDLPLEQMAFGFASIENYVAYFKGSDSINVRDHIVDGSTIYVVLTLKSLGVPGATSRITTAELELIT